MEPPPPYKETASMSRSRTAGSSVQEAAEAMLRSSLSRTPSSPSSTGASPPPLPSPSTPLSSTEERSSPPKSPAVAGRARLASASYLPIMGSSLSTANKSASTAERLRVAERERDELRRIVQGERALVERLKREGSRPGYVSKKEAKRRVSQLQEEARTAAGEVSQRPGSGLFKEACSTDLLFLIDSTSSMQNQIDNVKKQVKNIVTDITTAFLNEAEVRIAVVAYRDHADRPNIQQIDFTTSANAVFAFLDKLTAKGGGDAPEDVLGGIRHALDASWEQPTRCIIHIADAPPHGRGFQDEPFSKDNYPKEGTEPHGLTYEPLLKQMAGLSINYALLPINSSTDRMAYLFSQMYLAASADAKLNTSNRYCYASDVPSNGQSSRRGAGSSKRSAQGSLLFIEAEMGTIHSCLRRLVVKSVLSSAPRTALRASQSAGRTSKKMGDKTAKMTLTDIDEDHHDFDDSKLEIAPPKWSTPGWLDETIAMEGFSPDVVIHGVNTLNNMMQHDDKIKMSITELTIHKRSRPFAQGALRLAAYARTAASTNPFVVKSFKHGGKQLVHLAEDMRCQALCKAFALEFNALVGERYSVDFIVTTCLQGKADSASSGERLSLEPFIKGTYVKYNSNCGYINEEISQDLTNKAAQAFSHFTFERSRGNFLISDLQGAGNALTDPAIHTLDPERFKLTDTNLGVEGFKFFFATHECNDVCRTLGLKSTAAMLMSGKYEFKDKWPDVGSTVCCSSKLCGKIVRLETANKSLKYPGFYWCDTCWPQLDSSMTRWACVGGGPYHTFQVSAFFYESQGRLVPRTCPTHRVRDESVPRPRSEGGGFWSRLGFK